MSSKNRPNHFFLRVVLGIVLFLAVAEFGIRFTGIYAQLSEKNGHSFLSLFDTTHHGEFQNYRPYDTVHINNAEFSYVHAMDAYGFRNNPVPDTCAVLALGDSFTEGLGAPQDSTWPALLGTRLQAPVYNAGVMGGDPVFGLRILTRNPMGIAARKAVFVVNYSDITDLVIRGGTERFMPDGSVRYRQAPWFMPLYRWSHLFRALIHMGLGYDYMFNTSRTRADAIHDALQGLVSTLREAQTYCDAKDIRMYVFVHPVPQEYYRKLDRRLDFSKIDTLVPMLAEQHIRALNMRLFLESRLRTEEDWKSVSWPVDGHFNSKGYALMAECIALELARDTSRVY